MDNVFFAVHARDESVVKPYLYSHAEVVGQLKSSRPRLKVIVVRVSSERGAQSARTLAEQQRDRLLSGLYPTTDVVGQRDLLPELLKVLDWI